MSEAQNQNIETKKCKSCGPCEKGTTSLIVASIFIAIGIYSWIQNGFIPTSVIFAAPPFLIIGIYLKYLYTQNIKTKTCSIKQDT